MDVQDFKDEAWRLYMRSLDPDLTDAERDKVNSEIADLFRPFTQAFKKLWDTLKAGINAEAARAVEEAERIIRDAAKDDR